MRYGINFGAPSIPGTIQRAWKRQNKTRNTYLAGVCDSLPEVNSMRIIMDNGMRQIRIDNIMSNGKQWFGLVQWW